MSSKNTKLGFNYYPVESALGSLEDLAKETGIGFDVLHSCVIVDFLMMFNTGLSQVQGEGSVRLGSVMSSFLRNYTKHLDEFEKYVSEVKKK